jgi:hypothetical protein
MCVDPGNPVRRRRISDRRRWDPRGLLPGFTCVDPDQYAGQVRENLQKSLEAAIQVNLGRKEYTIPSIERSRRRSRSGRFFEIEGSVRGDDFGEFRMGGG